MIKRVGSVTSTISINVNCRQRQLMVVYEGRVGVYYTVLRLASSTTERVSRYESVSLIDAVLLLLLLLLLL